MLRTFIRLILSFLLFVTFIGVEYACAQPVSRYEVQAAFIHKFIKFIEWPEDALPTGSNVIVVGIIGKGPMVNALNNIKGKEVKGLKIVVRKVSELHELEHCNILFISPSEEKRNTEILNTVKGSNILTIGQRKGFARKGVIINFVVVDNKIRFEINLNAGEGAGLRISSKLLSLATEVMR